MNLFEVALRSAARDLGGLKYRWALVGGFAVSAQVVVPRLTADVDITVAVPDDDTAESLTRSLMASGYGFVASVEHGDAGRLATVRLASPGLSDRIVVDLLFASSGIEPEIVVAAEPLEVLAGLTLPVARVGHLIATKLLARDDARRPHDLTDLRALLEVATADDLVLAWEAVELITRRGFNRDRDLAAALAELLG